MNIGKTVILFFFVFLFTSCFLSKNAAKPNESEEKKEMSFIYLFDEANKNRLNGNLKTALEQYISALEKNPESAASYFYIASIYILQKDYETALSYSEKAVKLQPRNFWYSLEKSDLLVLIGQNKEAISLYNSLLNTFPEKELLYNKLINIYTENKEKENLITVLEKKQKEFDYSPETAVKLFNLYLQTQNYIKAENTINLLIKKYPNDVSFKGMAAEYYYNVNETEKAAQLYSELLKKYPDNNDVKLSYAIFCKRTNKQEEFYQTTKKLMTSDIDIIKKTSLLNSGQYRNFPDDEYLALLNELYKTNPNDILSNTYFAEYYIDKNDKIKAIPYIRKSLEINPSDFNIALMLFSLDYDVKDFKNLSEDTKTYVSYFPNQPQLFLYKGIAEYNLQNYSDAIKSLKIGKNLIIDDRKLEDQFNFYLSLVYKKEKDYKKAIVFAQKILDHNNKDIKIFELYGDLLFATDKKSEALSYWNKAKENGNDSEELNFKITNFNKLTIDDIIK